MNKGKQEMLCYSFFVEGQQYDFADRKSLHLFLFSAILVLLQTPKAIVDEYKRLLQHANWEVEGFVANLFIY